MFDPPPNRLHRQLARDILLHLRMTGIAPGAHVTEVSLQALLGTSRGPIRAALSHLAAEGYLERQPNKGFFLTSLGDAPSADADLPVTEDERIYLQLADDRLAGQFGERVGEADLMRRYGRPRAEIQRVLTQIAAEGWIRRRSGHGWAFLPMIDSVESYRESYELRRVLEPAGLRLPAFSSDTAMLRELRGRQERIHAEGHRTLGQVELYRANSDFHEAVAGMSGNRFLVQAVTRQNALRRLVEYRQTLDRERVHRQTGEHLAIIDALLEGRIEPAAMLLERHIAGAAREKATPDMFDRPPAGTEAGRRRAEVRGAMAKDAGSAARSAPKNVSPPSRP